MMGVFMSRFLFSAFTSDFLIQMVLRSTEAGGAKRKGGLTRHWPADANPGAFRLESFSLLQSMIPRTNPQQTNEVVFIGFFSSPLAGGEFGRSSQSHE
jgi:hypothetical protein